MLGASIALFASACTGSATVNETSAGEPTAVERPTVDAVEPTAVPAQPTTEAAEPAEPTAVPATPTPELPSLPVESFNAENLLAIGADGRYGYAGTSAPWAPTPCDGASADALVAVNIEAAVQGDIRPVEAGLDQIGTVRQLMVGPDGSVAVLSWCGDTEQGESWLQRIALGSDGRVAELGPVIPVGIEEGNDPFLRGWLDAATVEIGFSVAGDADDGTDWYFEHQRISLDTGELLDVEIVDPFDDSAFVSKATLTTPDGFTYRAIDDPDGSFGCEGVGVARTLEVDDGESVRLALTQPELIFSDVADLHMSASGHIAWTSGCEGFVSAFVGKVLPDGLIADAHLIDFYTEPFENYVEYRAFRLTDDGYLVGVGQSLDSEGDSSATFLRYDLAADPNFVNTADPAPSIDAEPLLIAIGGDGGWHAGESLAAETACGGNTLYGQTPGGFVRAFPAGIEMDTIVALDAAETRVIEYDDGSEFISRTVVAQTECPGSYEGRQVWFGLESGSIVWGMSFSQADIGEVANVLSVRDVVEPGTQFVERSIVEVELLDGTIVEAELSPLPFDG